MNYQLALIIGAREGEHSQTLEQTVRSCELDCAAVSVDSAVERLKEMTAAGVEPAIILIGPEVRQSLSVARRVRSVWPYGEVLFVPDTEEQAKLQRELRLAPMIGTNWSLSTVDNPHLPRMIKKAARSSRQRMRLRTTIDKANIRLSSAKPIDSTDYRRLVLSEHYLATLLEQSQDTILSLDPQNRILYWSTGAERLFKRSAHEMQGTAVQDMPFWSPELETGLRGIHSGAKRLTLEAQCALPEGSVDLEVLFSGVHDHTGRFLGTSLALRDISRRTEMFEVERAARQKAEETSRMKDEFLAILSHELRTPLSTVIGRTQLLQYKHSNDPELLASLDIIERNAHMQARLIDDLLDVSSVITGKLQLDIEPLSVNELCEAAIESIRAAAEEKRIEIYEKRSAVKSRILGDRDRLQQILGNLLSNAVKFTPEGGHIEVSTAQRGYWIEIAVQDNGAGISEDFLPRVFNRFGQEDSSASRSFGGLGLGLSIAKHLVELHGGEIHAQSHGKNQGSRFTVRLPAQQASTSPRVSGTGMHEKTLQETPLKGHRILVVEDVPDARDLVTEILQKQGAAVCAAESGEKALQALDGFHPDVLVSDIGMPGMDGYKLLQTIRARGHSSETLPAIALTAFASPADRAKALLAGFQKHVAKPMIVSEIVHSIKDILDRAKRPGGGL